MEAFQVFSPLPLPPPQGAAAVKSCPFGKGQQEHVNLRSSLRCTWNSPPVHFGSELAAFLHAEYSLCTV